MVSEKDILKKVEEDKVKFIQLQFTDLLGVPKAVTITTKQLEDSMKYGTWFDGSSIEGFARIQESDSLLKPDANTYAILPWITDDDKKTARFFCDIYTPKSQPSESDPRFILKEVLNEAKEMGYEYNVAPELEFYLFETQDGQPVPVAHDKGGYFDMTHDPDVNIRKEMVVMLEKLGIEVEAMHHEVEVGQHEIDIKYGDALKTADSGVTVKTVVKIVAQQNDLHATFMPKPIAGKMGSGMHIHQSLFKDGKNIFYDKDDPYKLSAEAKSFFAGQLEHIDALTAILNPTINSYKRLVPGFEAPVYKCWATINRSALIRVPRFASDKTEAARAEIRSSDATANLYLAFAVMLKAGLEGINKNLELPDPVEENIYRIGEGEMKKREIETLPTSLNQALDALEKDSLVGSVLGIETLDKYLRIKREEVKQYNLQVSDWERDRYFESY